MGSATPLLLFFSSSPYSKTLKFHELSSIFSSSVKTIAADDAFVPFALFLNAETVFCAPAIFVTAAANEWIFDFVVVVTVFPSRVTEFTS